MLYSSVGHRESEMPERVQKMPSHVKSNLRQSLLTQEWEMEEYFFCALRRTTTQTNTRFPTLFDTADKFRFFQFLIMLWNVLCFEGTISWGYISHVRVCRGCMCNFNKPTCRSTGLKMCRSDVWKYAKHFDRHNKCTL